MEEKVNFYCEAKGTQPLYYIWLHNNKITDKRRDNRLTITAGEKSEGEYQCKVKNDFGLESSEVVRIKVGECQVLCLYEQYTYTKKCCQSCCFLRVSHTSMSH